MLARFWCASLALQHGQESETMPKVGIKIESVEIVWYYQDYATLDYSGAAAAASLTNAVLGWVHWLL